MQDSPQDMQAPQGPFWMPPTFPCFQKKTIKFYFPFRFRITHLGRLFPDQPNIHRRGGRTTYIQVPVPSGSGRLWHPHLVLQHLGLSYSPGCCLMLPPMLFLILCLEHVVPALLLLSFLLSFFLCLALRLLSRFPLPSHLFRVQPLHLVHLVLKLHVQVVFHRDF